MLAEARKAVYGHRSTVLVIEKNESESEGEALTKVVTDEI
jgi:hypothetical protein